MRKTLLLTLLLSLILSVPAQAQRPSGIALEDVGKLTVLQDDTPFLRSPGGQVLGRLSKGDVLHWAFSTQNLGQTWYAAWSPQLDTGHIRTDLVQAGLFTPAPIEHPVQATLHWQPGEEQPRQQSIGAGEALTALVDRINQATSLPRDSVCMEGYAWLVIDTAEGQQHRVDVAGDNCPMIAINGQAYDLRTPEEIANGQRNAGGGPYIDDLVYALFDEMLAYR